MTVSLWCEWAWLDGPSPSPSVSITIEGDRITSVAAETGPPAGSTRLAGLTLPGFANTHSHAFHRRLRGRTQAGEASFWTWRDQMYQVASELDPDTYYDLALSTYSEMLRSGFTAVGEFHYLHHSPEGLLYAEPNVMSEAILAAAAAAGIRMTLLDTLYLFGGLDRSGRYQELNYVQRRFSDGSAQRWAARVETMRETEAAKIGAAVHSVRAVDPGSMEVVREWAETREAPLHLHLSEQPEENEQSIAVYGMTPASLCDTRGLLGHRTTVVHATHITDDDARTLGQRGVTACFCPTTERDLADGIGPSTRLHDEGVRLTIGSDSQAIIDAFEETRALELNQRLRTLTRGNHSVEDLLTYATQNGYRSLGWDEGGRLRAGSLADTVTVAFDSDVEPQHMLAHTVFVATGDNVTATMVGGTLKTHRPN